MKNITEMLLEITELRMLENQERPFMADEIFGKIREDLQDIYEHIESVETALDASERERDMMQHDAVSAHDLLYYDDYIAKLEGRISYLEGQIKIKEQIIEELETQLPDLDKDTKKVPFYDEDLTDDLSGDPDEYLKREV